MTTPRPCYFCGREEHEHYGSGKRCGIPSSFTEPKAWVIQCNDLVVCVVIGSEEEANVRIGVEREAYYQSRKGSWVIWHPVTWAEMTDEQRQQLDREHYGQRVYWRASEVNLY